MIPQWVESEFVFCDLQAVARFLRRHNPTAARASLLAAYDTFEFLAQHPGAGRCRADLGFPEVRSWRVEGYRNYLVFCREVADGIQIWRVLHGALDLPTRLSA